LRRRIYRNGRNMERERERERYERENLREGKYDDNGGKDNANTR